MAEYGPSHPLGAEANRRKAQMAQASLPPSPVQRGFMPGGGGYGSRPGEIPGQAPAALGGTGYAGHSGDANLYRGVSGGAINDYLAQSTPALSQQGPEHQGLLAHMQGQRHGELMASMPALKPMQPYDPTKPVADFGTRLAGAGVDWAREQAGALPPASPVRPGGLLAGQPKPMGVAAPGQGQQRSAGSLLAPGSEDLMPRPIGALTGALGLPRRDFPEDLGGQARPLYAQTKYAGPTGIPGVHPMPGRAMAMPQPPQVAQVGQAAGGGMPAPADHVGQFLAGNEQNARALEQRGFAFKAAEVRAAGQAQAHEMRMAQEKMGMARQELAQNAPLVQAQAGHFTQQTARDKFETEQNQKAMAWYGPIAFARRNDPNTTPEQLDQMGAQWRASQAQGMGMAGAAGAPPPAQAPPLPVAPPGAPPQVAGPMNAPEAHNVLAGANPTMPGYEKYLMPTEKGGSPAAALTAALADYPGLMNDPTRGPAFGAAARSSYGIDPVLAATQPPWTFFGLWPESAHGAAKRKFWEQALATPQSTPNPGASPTVNVAGARAPAQPAGSRYKPFPERSGLGLMGVTANALANSPWWNWAGR